jgi:uncharacterized membrane protein YeaQ/YmgE (transglycosylase-associated protein family)
MEEQQVGWIAAIIIGGIAGWLAEQFMKSQMGLVMNIVIGIIGAAVASWLFGLLGITFAGWIGYLIAGFIGACNLIAIRPRVQQRSSAANTKSGRRRRAVL